ncbi:MAG: hypothetical protein HYS15_02600 [Candidatus Spechtbacteria bacterium]|nr:hypothetical protein [Candidatus Spechtbacteria bacterium]
MFYDDDFPGGYSSDQKLEILKSKASLALQDPKLVELVKNAPLNSESKVNLSWVDQESFKYALEQTGSAKTAEALRKSTRALATLRRDYEEEFKRLISRVETPAEHQGDDENKRWDLVIATCNVEQIIHQVAYEHGSVSRDSVILRFGYPADLAITVSHILQELMNKFDQIGESKKEFQGALFKLLEEKFGLKVRTCGNCKNFTEISEWTTRGSQLVGTCKMSRAARPTSADLQVFSGDSCTNNMLHGVMNSWEQKKSSA